MKTKSVRNEMSWMKLLTMVVALASVFTLASCDDDDPVKEDVPELITKATLTFTPVGSSGAVITATATDPDGEGVNDLTVDGPINLAAGATYTLTISLINELADPNDEEYNITEEVEEEGDEHMFFFGWTGDVFADPTGNGNIDNRADGVNYEDEDVNGLPLGLTTSWTTSAASNGTFRVVLKHQPDLKTTTSGFDTGETDLDVTFVVGVN